MTVSGEITAEKNINVSADGDITNSAAVTADNSVEFVADGNITNSGALESTAGSVNLTADDEITNSATIKAAEDITMQAVNDITNKATLVADNDVQLTSDGGDINNSGAVTADNSAEFAADGDITNSAAVTADNLLNFEAGGNITNSGALESAAGSVNLTAGDEITNSIGATIKAAEDIAMQAVNDITNKATLVADNDVQLTSDGGDINNSAAVTADNLLNFEAGGNITNSGALESAAGSVNLTAGDEITNSIGATIKAAEDITMQAVNDITNEATLAADNDVQLTSDDGNINNSGALESAVGSVILTAGDEITNSTNATIKAAEDITMQAVNNITNEATLAADNDVQLTSDDGDINIGETGTVTSQQGNIRLVTKNTDAADKGTININADLDAKNTIYISADHGNVFVNADLTAQEGNVVIDVVEGNIKSDHYDEGDNVDGKDVGITAVNGSVAVYTGKGDIDIHEVYAKNNAVVGTENGHLKACSINGDIVILVTKDAENSMDIKNIVAGEEVIFIGNKINVDDIEQRDDSDGMLVINPIGADCDKPIDVFNIDNIKTKNGIRFDRLWVKNANVSSNARLYIDKLAVVNVAHFSNQDMRTAVYGAPPLRDGSDSIYWYDYEANDPKNNLLGWYNDEYIGNWMHLYFTDQYRTQISNGVLLSLKDHYHVYNQRFTGENHLRFLSKDMPKDVRDRNSNPNLSLYQRFALYELPETEQGESVGEEDLILAESI